MGCRWPAGAFPTPRCGGSCSATVRIDWSPEAVSLASRFLHDTAGMAAVVAAVDALADDPCPAEAFHRGGYHRLRVGAYRVQYAVDGDLITVERVDCVG